MNYNASEFSKIVGAENQGQITMFRKFLQENGMVPHNRAPYTEREVVLFEKAKEAKLKNNLSWEQAFQEVIVPQNVGIAINQVINAISNLDDQINAMGDDESEAYYDAFPNGLESLPGLIELFQKWNSELRIKKITN